MPSETLKKIDQSLLKIVKRPIQEVLNELKTISVGDRGNPAPHLVMSIITALRGKSRNDFVESKKHLSRAGTLLSRGRRNDSEWQFSQNLFDLMQNEFALIGSSRGRIGSIRSTEREKYIKAAFTARKAIENMGRLVRRLRGSSAVNVINAASQILSRVSNCSSPEYKRGMASLSRRFNSSDSSRDLAGYFLQRGYQKNRKYALAARVVKILERRNPRSLLPKVELAGIYTSIGNFKVAENYYKKAEVLAPKDVSVQISHAQLLDLMGQGQMAEKVIQKAKRLDTRRKFTGEISNVGTTLRIKKKLLR